MLIAKKKKKENIAEYLIYVWQIEDIIRANDLDIDSIQTNIIDAFDQDESVKLEMREWYDNLIAMIRHEGVTEHGHLQVNKNVIIDLTDLHIRILNNPQEMNYSANYYKTLPFIVELRAKSEQKDIPELETCFSALYGYLLLKLQQKQVSGDTQAAIAQISTFIRLLAEKCDQDINGKLEL